MPLNRGPFVELDDGMFQCVMTLPASELPAFLRQFPERKFWFDQPAPAVAAHTPPSPAPQFASVAGVDAASFGSGELPLSDIRARLYALIANPQFQAAAVQARQVAHSEIPDAEEFAALFVEERLQKPLSEITESDIAELAAWSKLK